MNLRRLNVDVEVEGELAVNASCWQRRRDLRSTISKGIQASDSPVPRTGFRRRLRAWSLSRSREDDALS